jgi:integrase
MARRTLNDRLVAGLKPAKPGARYDVWDSIVPGFGVNVTSAGHRSFIVAKRIAGAKQPTRRKIGDVGAMSLADAREKARGWLALIAQGKDPSEEEERDRQAEQGKRRNSFASVVEDFFKQKLPGQRKAREVERDIRNNFVAPWGARPITDVTEDDVFAVVKAKARTAPGQARNLLGYAKQLFQWAKDQRSYGLATSPARDLRPMAIVGEKRSRDRLLSDDEVLAFWRAARRTPYPYGPAYRLLALSGLRLNEVADASWPEFHPAVVQAIRQRQDGSPIDWTKVKPEQLTWVIPASRMKGKNTRARAHVVPLVPDMLAILEELPLFKGGDFLFSTAFGEKPAWIGDKVKKRVDERMLRTLRALARRRGDDPVKVRLERWQNHDLRRVVRSGLSRLRIPEEVREAVLAHVRPGIKQTYDVHDYASEKRDALVQWQGLLRNIVEPPREPATEPMPQNVVPISARKAAAVS